MWFLKAPASVAGLVAIALLPSIAAKPYPVHTEELRDIHNATDLERRQCSGTPCGWYGQLCCASGETCITDANNQAQCAPASGGAQITQGGGWQTFTTTWVETGLVTRTSVWSTYVGATPQATPNGCSGSQSLCGTVCCDGGYYCFDEEQNLCRIIGGSSSPGISGTATPSAPLRPTSSTLIIVTATGSPTATVPFSTPIATGVNGTLLPAEGGGGGLSGGAIAGIVIGVIAGIILLFLICMYCCAKTAFDAIAAIFGFGKKRKHTHEETTYIESHHHGAGGGGRWYGQPSRPGRPKKDGGMFGGALGIGALLGGLALALGLKRRHDRKHDDKSTTISGSSAYYSDYTSSSSASSDDRRTRRSSRR